MRLQTQLPPVEPNCPPGIPTTIDGMFVGRLLGEGASGKVFPLIKPGRGEFTEVVKCIPKKTNTHIGGLKAMKHQLKIMKILSEIRPHPNVVKLHMVYHIDAYILFRMENGGALNLYRRLKLREQQEDSLAISQMKVASLVKQGIRAVAHLHSCMIAHRDIKPENVCIQETAEEIVFKLADFDVAVECEQGQALDNICGTFPFTAPEMYLQDDYTPFPTDMWSLGCMSGEVVCGLHMLDRHLRLTAYRKRFEQESGRSQTKEKGISMAAKKYLSRRINEHFLKEHAASKMIEEQVLPECELLVNPLLAMFDSMIAMPASNRAAAPEILEMSETLLPVPLDDEPTTPSTDEPIEAPSAEPRPVPQRPERIENNGSQLVAHAEPKTHILPDIPSPRAAGIAKFLEGARPTA